jgi:transketolase
MQDRNDLDATCINTIRGLAMDTVQAAASGHPGAPLAAVARVQLQLSRVYSGARGVTW